MIGAICSFTPHSSPRCRYMSTVQLWQSCRNTSINEIDNLTKELCACTDDIKAWVTENQLKLNDDKREALLFSFFSSSKPAAISLPDSITLGCHNIPFSYSARNLGFILDSELSMKKHVIKICQTAHFELKRISSIRRFLTEDATQTLVTSYILSRLDYCNFSESSILCCKTLPHGTSLSLLYTSPDKAALASHSRAH